ncbi:uncharacterized protein LOC131180108 [Hevea brasiliensis]|uniref:uncharacterized protein LOC131180108 n=1 Tax=Hevea brasiliensis TaxID=3981 RepID=UPI0025D0802B|nr:uncharacterized protein LOC131180108 [Hevea brasiliensis]
MTRKAVKGSVIANLLAENPINDYEALDFEFPNEYINAVSNDAKGPIDVWEMYFDGAVNLAGNGIGVVLVALDGRHYPIAIKLRFGCTNNVVEYEACVSGLQAAIKVNVNKLKVYGHSALIIYQVKGEWQTKDPKLIQFQKYLLELIKEFEEISFTHMSRDNNQFADALATLAVMTKMEEGQITQLLQIKVRSKQKRKENDQKISNGILSQWRNLVQEKLQWNNIICRYGLPREFVTDNAKNLNGLKIQKLCAV